jgi:AcrR family transcriptional regulator
MPEREQESAPRGRHAPPLEVRQDRQRRRLYAAAGAVFARIGYADATAEAIAREAGMSKATFYEHFDNKEDCICALFDTAAETLLGAIGSAEADAAGIERSPRERYRQAVAAFLEVMAEHPNYSQTLLVEIIGAGPRAMERRDRVLAAFAAYIDHRNAEDAAAGLVPRLASPHDAFAIVGAVVELASRQLRNREPADVRELTPIVERLITGMLAAAAEQPTAT